MMLLSDTKDHKPVSFPPTLHSDVFSMQVRPLETPEFLSLMCASHRWLPNSQYVDGLRAAGFPGRRVSGRRSAVRQILRHGDPLDLDAGASAIVQERDSVRVPGLKRVKALIRGQGGHVIHQSL